MASERSAPIPESSPGDVADTISLVEERPTTVELESRDRTYLQEEWEDAVEIGRHEGQPQVTVQNKAGVIGLPSGRVLTVSPKIETNLLYLLAYTGRIDEQVITKATDAGYQSGDSLIRLLGQLFLSEFERVRRRGLAQAFRETESTQRHLRGQLQLTKQFRTQGPVPLQFECRYQELTHDIPINRVVLAATRTLVRLLSPSPLRNSLIQYRELLEDRIEVPNAPLRELDAIAISHLTDHYRQLLLLSKLILQERFLCGIDHPEHPFPSLVFDMPGVSEDAVVEAVRAAVDADQFRVTENDLGVLAEPVDSATDTSRRLQPDFVIRERDSSGTDTDVVAVGDAKWKTSVSPSRDDLYQIATYQAKFGTPGILVYPTAEASESRRYRYVDTAGGPDWGDLIVTELSLQNMEPYRTYVETLDNGLSDAVAQLTAGRRGVGSTRD